MVKELFRTSFQDVHFDGLYTSLAPIKSQHMWEDYQQIYVDFGVNSEQKIKNRVLFLHALANLDLKIPDVHGHFLFDFSCQPPIPLV